MKANLNPTCYAKSVLLLFLVIASFSTFAQENPASQYYYQGVSFMTLKLYMKALPYFDSTLLITPNDQDALNNKGICHYEAGQYDKAIEVYVQVLALNPLNQSALINCANVWYGKRDLNKAIHYFRQAEKAGPIPDEAKNTLANIYADQGDYQKAIPMYTAILTRDPENAAANYNLGNLYYERGLYDSAYFFHSKAVKNEALNLDYLFNMSLDLASQNRQDRYALKICKDIIEKDPSYYRAWAQVAYLMMAVPGYNPEEVLPYLNKAIELHPKNISYAYSNRGDVYERMGLYTEAMAQYDQAIADDPSNPFPYAGKANLYRNKGNYAEAVKNYMLCIRLDSTYQYPYLGLGMVMTCLKENKKAEVYYTQYLQRRNYSREARLLHNNNKGYALLLVGKYQEALTLFSQAIDLDPQYAFALNNKGMALAKTGDFKNALSLIEQSIRINPYNSYAFHNRAYVYAATGKPGEACTDLKRAVQMHYPERIDSVLSNLSKNGCGLTMETTPAVDTVNMTQLLAQVQVQQQVVDEAKKAPENQTRKIQNQKTVVNQVSAAGNAITHLYPNPATNIINLTLAFRPEKTLTAIIYSSSGEIIKSILFPNISSLHISFDCSDLKSGKYLVMLIEKNNVLGKGNFVVVR